MGNILEHVCGHFITTRGHVCHHLCHSITINTARTVRKCVEPPHLNAPPLFVVSSTPCAHFHQWFSRLPPCACLWQSLHMPDAFQSPVHATKGDGREYSVRSSSAQNTACFIYPARSKAYTSVLLDKLFNAWSSTVAVVHLLHHRLGGVVSMQWAAVGAQHH